RDWWNQEIPSGHFIHHIDGDFTNNEIFNLTNIPGIFHATRHAEQRRREV
ncbi:unnamed protein product, partial [marine sediment metagenome]